MVKKKFKVWDEENEVIRIVSRIDFYDDGTVKLPLYSDCFKDLPIRGKFTLLQFTGLIDKNKKEIYEGHILRRLGGTEEEAKYEYYIVEIKKQRFAYPINRPEEWSDIFKDDEVIGNIYEYEHPELLGVED